ncbi:uncharacterized protein C2orf72 homolog [Pseudonaja textilis]|uniref:C2orf72-like C-terminal domain-containing protein n=1 Tax=Pseudonaja textilis TaxID=8673 RepID=A0A670ZMI2_PSETE|nr:uncharacterized protein C2orf72 homolog [Pseudonaja textilis]
MEPEALRDLRALLERAGGREPLRLAGEVRPAELQTFARDLFAEPPPPPPLEEPEKEEGETEAVATGRTGKRRRARMRSGGGRHPLRGCALLFALFLPASLEQPREMRRLREILRDLRAQLPAAAPPPAVVGVVLLLQPPENPEAPEAARLQLEGLLRRVFSSRRRRSRSRDPGLPDTLQAVAYRPGDGRAAREAACRALRAALKLRADGAELPKPKLPALLSCIPWGRRSEDFQTDAKLNEDAIQDLEGAMALTNIAPNGKCEEASETLNKL